MGGGKDRLTCLQKGYLLFTCGVRCIIAIAKKTPFYGSYKAVFGELRFMLESVTQAYYVDLNHYNTSIMCKLEVYKALGDR
jgi:hypothetical protein